MVTRSPENRTRAESFGSIAQDYDRIRPGYPAELIADILVGQPREALDVGCGTGIAARLVRDRGVEVLGVEVDERMAAVARGHGIEVEVGRFETWDSRQRLFDLVFSAQAWHWVDPVAGAAKAAEVLRPGGRLALFWNFFEFDPRIEAALDAAYVGVDIPPDSVLRGGDRSSHHGDDLEASGLFEAVQRRLYGRDQVYRRDDWLALISTHSDHSTLPPDELAALLARVSAAVDGLGGAVPVHYVTHAVITTVIEGSPEPS